MHTSRTGYINVRVEPKVKASATRILKKSGITTSDAINLFLTQIVLHQGIPFKIHVPNAETIAAIRKTRNSAHSHKKYKTTDALFNDILGKDWKKNN